MIKSNEVDNKWKKVIDLDHKRSYDPNQLLNDLYSLSVNDRYFILATYVVNKDAKVHNYVENRLGV